MLRLLCILFVLIISSCSDKTSIVDSAPAYPDDGVFVSTDTVYYINGDGSTITLYSTVTGGSRWTSNTASFNAHPEKLFAFKDTLIVLARYFDTSDFNHIGYLLMSVNKGKDWKQLYKTRHYVEDIMVTSPTQWQLMLRLDTVVDNNEFPDLHQLVESNNGSLSTICLVQNEHFFTGILTAEYIYAFTSPDTTDDVTGVRIINNKTLEEKRFDIDTPYFVVSTKRVHSNGSLYVPLHHHGRGTVLKLDKDKVEFFDLKEYADFSPGELLVEGNSMCLSVYNEEKEKYALLASGNNGNSWRIDTTFNLPLNLTAPFIFNDTLYSYDTLGMQKISLK